MNVLYVYRGWNAVVIDATMPINANGDALVDALLNICEEAAEAVQGEYIQILKSVKYIYVVYSIYMY